MTVKISALTAGSALDGTEALEAVQAAASVKLTAAQIKTYARAGLAISDVASLQAALDAKADDTDLASYYTSAAVDALLAGYQPLDATLTALAALDSSAGFVVQTAADVFTKRALLAGDIPDISATYATQANLTANQTADRARANHTGTQLAATISDFNESVDDRVAALVLFDTGLSGAYDDTAGSLTISLDADLVALAGLSATAGLLEQTGAAAFTKRAMGVGASTSVLTRADGDGRFAALSHTHAAADVTSGVFAMARLATGTPDGTKFVRDDGTLVVPTGFANPMTTADDLIKGGASGAAARLAKGTNGDVLTMVAGAVAWQAPSGSPPFVDTTAIVKGSADATKLLRFEVDGFTTGTTRVATFPNADITVARIDAAQTFTGAQTFGSPSLANDTYSVSTPSYSRSGDPDTGLGFPAANQASLIAAGAEIARATATGLDVGANYLKLGSAIGTTTVGLKRLTSGAVERLAVDDGAGGYNTGILTGSGLGTPGYAFGASANSGLLWNGGSSRIEVWNGGAAIEALTTTSVIPGGDATIDHGSTAARWNNDYAAAQHVATANGALGSIKTISESITLSTGGLTTDSTANLLPANSIILHVLARVTTTITTTTNWAVGDGTTSARFSSANATLTSGTTSVGLNHMKGSITTDAAGPVQTAAAKLRITCTGSNPGAGVIRVTVVYMDGTPPTS